jgi:predicted regulator of Ras-like GTPase activity (Roadblock/LC7/MglB family)
MKPLDRSEIEKALSMLGIDSEGVTGMMVVTAHGQGSLNGHVLGATQTTRNRLQRMMDKMCSDLVQTSEWTPDTGSQ